MKNNNVRVFFGGDIFGAPGLRSATCLLPGLLESESIDFCVINGENSTAGIGISEADVQALLSVGVDVITGGNHTFEKRDLWPVLDAFPEVLRPANFPSGLPGRGASVYEKNGRTFAVLNLQGREDMTAIDCPFMNADAQLDAWGIPATTPESADSGADVSAEHVFPANGALPIVLVDFHAESNDEKEAMGLFLAGRAAAVVGTHTHVQTADEKILKGGTAYISDLGMTGPLSSVIGTDPAIAIKRNVSQVLYRMEIPEGKAALRGLIVDIDSVTRKAVAVQRVEILE